MPLFDPIPNKAVVVPQYLEQPFDEKHGGLCVKVGLEPACFYPCDIVRPSL
jgi:hypothetical protein